jgi:oxygen-dependent protoporphyrinogen oxidase
LSVTESLPRRWAIIGGGISGLAAAEAVARFAPHDQIRLLEAKDRCGGVLHTERTPDGWLIEHAADMFTTQFPDALALCERCGLTELLIEPQDGDRRAFVLWQGRLHPVPSGFVLMRPTRVAGILQTPLLSWRGKVRLLSELFVRRRAGLADESVAAFARRRLGSEALERLVQPLVGGIYTADPESLSMAATMPAFQAMEREHRSLLWAALCDSRLRESASSGARYGLFRAPRNGMQQLVEAVRDRLPKQTVQCNTPVTRVGRQPDGRWTLDTPAGSLEPFDRLLLAMPSHRAAELLGEIDQVLAGELSSIPHASSAVVAIGLRTDDLERPLPGFGCVVPLAAGHPMLAISCTSRKFAGRAPAGCELLRLFFGGALQPEWAEASDTRLLEAALQELRQLFGYRGEPLVVRVLRWRRAMPQYVVGHLERVARIRQRLAQWPGLAVAGAAYDGVGIPQCIRSAEQQVRRLLEAASASR